MRIKNCRRLNMSLFILPCLVLMTTVALAIPRVEAAPNGFVTPCGTNFCLNGQVFNVAGTNNHYLGFGTRAEVDQVLSDAKAMSVNVVRTIMHSVRGSLDSTQQNQGAVPLKWNWGSTAESSNLGMNGVYILYWDTASNKMAWNDSTENGLGRWDYVIWKAKQLNLKLNIALLDFWQWAGGVQQINSNFKRGSYDAKNAPDRYTFFFQNADTQQFYREWVNHVLNRTNTLTGIKYKDEPTIFAWDLMNEPEMAGSGLGRQWISAMSAYVKTIDPNHMVASGNEGFADGHAGSNPQIEMGISTIDFATWHTYPVYHNLSTNDVVNLINTNCQIGANGKKPVLLQEFGYPSSKSDQSTAYALWLNTIQNNPNCAGWLYWRLVSKQQNGQYPADNGEHLDIYNNNSASAQVFKNAAAKLIARNGSAPATNTPAPVSTTIPTSAPLPTNIPLPSNTPMPTTAAQGAVETFVKAINFNGSVVTIQGNTWLSFSSALGQGLSVSGAATDTKALPPNPATDAATDQMLDTLIYASTDPGTINLTQTIPNGTYHIYLWTMENYAGNQRRWNLTAEGIPMANNLGDLGMNQWKRYGAYTVVVVDGNLNLSLIGVVGRPMLMGMEIYAFK
ncbi:MAG: hypothetical protein GC179_01520 [Anaerolineaceae bacterium]|nr:hypothetical protein [Anaerolineaceae bacterium]